MEYPIITQEEFLNANDVCYENLIDNQVYDDIEFIYEDIADNVDLDDPEAINVIVKQSSKIPVYRKQHFQLPVGRVQEWIEEYVEDNWFMDYPYEHLNGTELIEKFEKDFNRAQTWFISGEFLGYLDIAKEIEKFIESLRVDIKEEE